MVWLGSALIVRRLRQVLHRRGNLLIKHGNLLIQKVDLRQVLRDQEAMMVVYHAGQRLFQRLAFVTQTASGQFV